MKTTRRRSVSDPVAAMIIYMGLLKWETVELSGPLVTVTTWKLAAENKIILYVP